MTKRLALVNGPAYGHVNPTLPLVEELLRRGHRVSYATGPELIPSVRAAGADPVTLPMEIPPPPRGDDEFAPEAMAPRLEQNIADLRESLPILEAHIREFRPDAVCADAIAPVGRIIAKKLGLPYIALLPNFASNEHFSLHDRMMSRWEGAFDPSHPVMVRFGEQIREVAAEHGVELEPHSMLTQDSASLNLVFIPREFQLEADTFDDRFAFVGPSVGHREDREQWQPASSDAPVLFISLGTMFHDRPEFYRMCIEAFRDSDWQVAMSVGQQVDPAELGEIPANFDVRSRFPQTAVLRQASAFLSHTGMNSTMESLYYGVPLVGVPQMPEQELNAQQAEALGLGRQLDVSEVDPALLRKTVDEVAADPALRFNLDEMRQKLRSSAGASASTDAIEAHLAGPSSST